jgi:hypothetical protein
MAKWVQVSKHEFTFGGLIKSSWPSLLLGFIFLPMGIGFLFIQGKEGEEWIGPVVATITLLGALALLAVAPWRFIRRVASARVYEQGISWHKGGSEEKYPWDEVREVYRTERHVLQGGEKPSDWNRTSDLRLVFSDGEEIRFNHMLSKYDRLANYVQQVTTRQLIPEALAELEEKDSVTFGPVEVSRDGLTIEEDFYPWKKVKRLVVGNGYLCCYHARDTSKDILLYKLPNYLVLFAVLEAVGKPVGSG